MVQQKDVVAHREPLPLLPIDCDHFLASLDKTYTCIVDVNVLIIYVRATRDVCTFIFEVSEVSLLFAKATMYSSQVGPCGYVKPSTNSIDFYLDTKICKYMYIHFMFIDVFFVFTSSLFWSGIFVTGLELGRFAILLRCRTCEY